MTLAEKVRMLRQKLGWSQTTLAQRSGLKQATLSRIEGGRTTQPRIGQLQKLAEVLGATIDYLAKDNVVDEIPPTITLPLCYGCAGRGWVDSQYKGVQVCPLCRGTGLPSQEPLGPAPLVLPRRSEYTGDPSS